MMPVQRLSWGAPVDEDGHYSFAVAVWCRGPPRAPIGISATPCDFARRLVGLSSRYRKAVRIPFDSG